jgi:acyl-CoA reductase-like NAD-dependent aldehyde dehydrogenase
LTALKIKDVLLTQGWRMVCYRWSRATVSTVLRWLGAGPDKIILTGSVATGKRVAEAAANYLISRGAIEPGRQRRNGRP